METIQHEYSPRACCEALNIKLRNFNTWQQRQTQIMPSSLQADLVICFERHKRRAGAPKLTRDLRELGHNISVRTVNRRMSELGLRARHPKKFKPTTESKHTLHISPNLLERDFSAAQPNQRWVGDITYLWTTNGWLYLATVIDLYSRAIVGWQMSDRIDAKLVTDALPAAYIMRGSPKGVMFHGDHGSQYCSDMFRKFLNQHAFVQSMSRKGNCWDNAVAESFFKSLKTEAVYGFPLLSRDSMRALLFEYIEVYYNTMRRHSAIGYVCPRAWEERLERIMKKRLSRLGSRQKSESVK